MSKHGEMGKKVREPEVGSSARRPVVQIGLIHRGGELSDEASDGSWFLVSGSVGFDESDEGGEILERSQVNEVVEVRESDDLFSFPINEAFRVQFEAKPSLISRSIRW